MIDRIKNLTKIAQGMKVQIKREYDNNVDEYESKRVYLSLLEESQLLIQRVAQDTQSKLKFKVEDVVNTALDAVFPDEYSFSLDFELSRGKTEARLV